MNEEDDRTPVLSRENSDVKTQFPNRYQWKSHLSTSMIGKLSTDNHSHNKPQSLDLLTSGTDIRILRLQPGFSSSCTSPITSSTTDSILKNSLTTKLTSNVVSNVDELRVSDFIIRSSFASKKNENKYETIDTPIAMSEHSSRKPSIVSIKNDSRQNNGRKSSVASIDSQNTTPNLRRTTLVTKNETLGLTLPHAVLNTKKTPTTTSFIEKSTLNNQSIDTLVDSQSSYCTQSKNNVIINKTTSLSNSLSENLPSKLKRINSSSMNACIAAAKVQHQKQQRQFMTISQRDLIESNNKKLTSENKNAAFCTNNLEYDLGADENIISTTKINRRQSDKRNNASSASGLLSKNITNTALSHRKSVNTTESVLRSLSSHQINHRPWRPPKRTAEEITLDKNLEVNWSVSTIRRVFQNKKDDKPAAIDTVYAKFDAIPKKNNK